MTQGEKDLLLKDLCSKLPYGVIVETPKGKGHICDINLTIFGTEVGVNINPTIRDTFNVEDVKPYLLPLSSMTEEHQKEEYYICAGYIIGYESNLIDFYNKYHYDYRGLIPMGVAIDATGKNIY